MRLMVYIPGENHPWRQYANKRENVASVVAKSCRPLKVVLEEVIQSWDTYEVYVEDTDLETRKLKSMADDKIARWLINFIKKYYLTQKQYYNYG